MFSAILGLAGAGISAFAGMAQADAQMQLAYEQLSLQRRALNDQQAMAHRQYQMAVENMRREREQEEYVKGINERNDRYLTEEYGLRLGSQRERVAQSKEEREYLLDRQIEMDKDAARRNAFQYEQYLRNSNLAADEREYAQKLLEDQRSIARGERDDDMRRFYREQQTAVEERGFGISELRRAQQIAASERADDASIRDSVVNRALGLSDTLRMTQMALGPAPMVPRISRSDIDAEIAYRTSNAVADVDRAITKVAGANEADLIRAGMDVSSQAIERRADIAARSAQEYARAREQARDSAMRYIGGVQDELMGVFAADMGRRQTVLGEAANIAGSGLNVLSQLRPLRSANDYRTSVPITSSNYYRPLASANNYRAPIGVGSAITSWDGGSDLASFLGVGSIAQMMDLNPGSRVSAAQSWNITSPATLAQGAMAGMGNAASAYGQNAASAFRSGFGLQQGGFASLSQALRSLGGLGDSFMSRQSAAAPQQAPAGNIYSTPIGPQQPGWGPNYWETPGLWGGDPMGQMSGIGFGGGSFAPDFGFGYGSGGNF